MYLCATDFLTLCVDDIRVRGLAKPCAGPQKTCCQNPNARRHKNLLFICKSASNIYPPGLTARMLSVIWPMASSSTDRATKIRTAPTVYPSVGDKAFDAFAHSPDAAKRPSRVSVARTSRLDE